MPSNPTKNLLAAILIANVHEAIEEMDNDLSSTFSSMPDDLREEFDELLNEKFMASLEKTVEVSGGG